MGTVQTIYRFTTTLKLENLVYLYLKKIIGKLVFKNDVFAKVNLTNLQISFHFSSFAL